MSDKQAVARMQRTVQELEAERLRLNDVADTWRERAERAEARLASLIGMQRQELARTTAEAQREACARHMVLAQDYSAQACRLAPLVTEEAP